MMADPTLAPTSSARAAPRSKIPALMIATAKAPATVDDWVMVASTSPRNSRTMTLWPLANSPSPDSQSRSGPLSTLRVSMPRNNRPMPSSTSTPWRTRSDSLRSK